jgi:hypothetical protein
MQKVNHGNNLNTEGVPSKSSNLIPNNGGIL